MNPTVQQILRNALEDAEQAAKWQREQQQQWRERSDEHRVKALAAERQVVALRNALGEQVTEQRAAQAAPALADTIAGWPLGQDYYQHTIGVDDAREIADALLPTVRAIAADELRAVADEVQRHALGGRGAEANLRARADELDPR